MEKKWAADWEANLNEIRELKAAVSRLSARPPTPQSGKVTGNESLKSNEYTHASVDKAVAAAARAAKEFLQEQRQKMADTNRSSMTLGAHAQPKIKTRQ